MAKINKHIEIVCSSVTELSSMSQESRKGVQAVLSKHYAKVGITIVNNLKHLEALAARRPDLIFLGVKFVPSNEALGKDDPNKIWVSDYLDKQGIPYTGSAQTAHELDINKHLAKQRVIDAGLQTSPFYIAKQNQAQTIDNITLDYPVFIKPTNRGGGLGVDSYSVAHNFNQVQSKVSSITTNHQSDSLIEEYLPGREFSVAILQDSQSDSLIVMPIELVAEQNADGHRILGEEMKSSNTEDTSKITNKKLRKEIIAFATDIYVALGARDYGRIDIRLDQNGVPHFLEANLIPSLISGYGSFPKACLLNMDMDHENVILNIAQLGLSRSTLVTVV